MRKFAKLTALLVALAMLSTLCAFPTMADATTLNEKFVDTFDYPVGTTYTNICDVAPTNKYVNSNSGTIVSTCDIVNNPYDATLGTSVKWKGPWYTNWQLGNASIKLSAPKMVISFKLAFPSDNTGAGLTIGINPKNYGSDFAGGATSQILQLNAAAPQTAGPRTKLGALATDTMHDFVIVINSSPDAETLTTFDLYINGVQKINKQNLYPGSKWHTNSDPLKIDGIGYIYGEGSGTVMDDLRVYTATAGGVTESNPANDATNVALETNSISVKFETDVTPDQMTTSNVSVSNATVSTIDRIDNKNYKINLANTLASKTEYVVSFGNAKDVLGNAITDTIKFTSFDAGFVPTKVVGPNENFENAELGNYAGITGVNTQGMFSNSGNATFEVKNNTIDSSLGKSAYITTNGNIVTQWDASKSMFNACGTGGGKKIVVSYKFAVTDASIGAPGINVYGYSAEDESTTIPFATVSRTDSGVWKAGGTRPTILTPLVANKIYDVAFVFTTGAAGVAKYDIYVDGTYRASAYVTEKANTTATYNRAMYSLNYIMMNVNAGTWFDDFAIYTSDGMAVESTFPVDGATDAKVKNFVTVKTSTPINFADTSAVALTNLGNVTSVEKVDGYTANIYFDGTVAYETTYTTKISGLKDLLGYTLTPKTITFTTGEFVPYEVGAISFTQNGTSVTANVNVTNNGTTPINPALIVAVYRGNLLVATNWVKQTVATTAPITATVSFTPEEGKTVADYSVKAYVWEDVSPTSIAPMADPTPFTLTAN